VSQRGKVLRQCGVECDEQQENLVHIALERGVAVAVVHRRDQLRDSSRAPRCVVIVSTNALGRMIFHMPVRFQIDSN